MRGLKLLEIVIDPTERKSHLLQMRGLKLFDGDNLIYRIWVASFTDAWIETKHIDHHTESLNVASFTDAWIETNTISNDILPFRSHLLQMRGLKLEWEAVLQ